MLNQATPDPNRHFKMYFFESKEDFLWNKLLLALFLGVLVEVIVILHFEIMNKWFAVYCIPSL